MKTRDYASLRCLFAKIRVSERNRYVSPTAKSGTRTRHPRGNGCRVLICDRGEQLRKNSRDEAKEDLRR